ncbi:PKD domain-containing protein [Humibacillus sp. DSM 29435]|uniref:PKD domain-containing protein n=1 Tax=Humibacillus sp. DSM 29435 TaxID=1869167 RepID=UPI000A81B700|nr:PKD domain-containing protein [Humibacillus sp. DSM 29435]
MQRQFRSTLAKVLWVVLALGLLQVAPAGQASAAPGQDTMVSEVPSPWTPAFNNGSVLGIVQTGSTMVAVGDFTSVTPQGGSAVSRVSAVAFNATTGALGTGFNPSFNGAVTDVIAGPTAGTVYLSGSFTQVNGRQARKVALVNVSDGSLVSSFNTPAINGTVNSLARIGNRLYLGGFFTSVGNSTHAGIASLNANTGALDSFAGNNVAERHNSGASVGAVGVKNIEATPDGSRLVAIGNFKTVDGLMRDQVVLLDLTGPSSVVQADWRTRRYEPACFSFAFDSYVRGLSVSPDGSYFVITSTGGQNAGTLCDTAARFEFSSTGDNVQPTWVDYAGGDTLWGVEVTEHAVYVGGHNRWMNNSSGSDYAGQGAVPRAGLMALDPQTGLPLAWNPGRNPRGVAVFVLYATPAGLWMGSNTDWVGSYKYKRPKLAFFPLAGGSAKASDAIAPLPGTAFVGGSTAQDNGNILYRVNAGGAAAGSVDAGPDWQADDQTVSAYRNTGSNVSGYEPGATSDGTVPSSTPNSVFDSERWSPSDDPAMEWAFNAPAGAPLQVRLFFANRYSGTSAPGSRIFDVSIDGVKKLSDFDIAATAGDQRGTMKAFDVVSDGTVDIDFGHVKENPLVNAIEIVRTDQAPPAAGANGLQTVQLSAGGAQPAQTIPSQGIDWTSVRGSFYAGGKLWYGTSAGTFNSRTLTGATLGPVIKIDPYNDPAWAGIGTGSGSSTYDGKPVDLYSQLSGVTAMAYADGRLYYVRSGDSNLYWRWFSTDSGIIGSQYFTANGGRAWAGTYGMFVADGSLYFVTADGALNKVALQNGIPTGGSTLVDGPSLSGTNWRARAVFVGPSSSPPANQLPTASFTSSCVGLVCTFNGAGSSDPDGSIAGYAWTFPSGSGTGQSVTHTFAEAGTYSVQLRVTDNLGGQASVAKQVTVDQGAQPTEDIAFVDTAVANGNRASQTLTVPASIQAGDTMVLAAAVNSTTTVGDPAGWTRKDGEVHSSMSSTIWTRTATASDAGSTVKVNLGKRSKVSLTLTAYRGVGSVGTVTKATDSKTASHATPTVTVPGGSWVVWVWSEKSASTSQWTPTGGFTARDEVYSTGTGRVSGLVGDSNGPQTGVVGGVTATTDVTSNLGVSWTLVLEPKVA